MIMYACKQPTRQGISLIKLFGYIHCVYKRTYQYNSCCLSKQLNNKQFNSIVLYGKQKTNPLCSVSKNSTLQFQWSLQDRETHADTIAIHQLGLVSFHLLSFVSVYSLYYSWYNLHPLVGQKESELLSWNCTLELSEGRPSGCLPGRSKLQHIHEEDSCSPGSCTSGVRTTSVASCEGRSSPTSQGAGVHKLL